MLLDLLQVVNSETRYLLSTLREGNLLDGANQMPGNGLRGMTKHQGVTCHPARNDISDESTKKRLGEADREIPSTSEKFRRKQSQSNLNLCPCLTAAPIFKCPSWLKTCA